MLRFSLCFDVPQVLFMDVTCHFIFNGKILQARSFLDENEMKMPN